MVVTHNSSDKAKDSMAIFVGTLPPPITGMTVVTSAVVNEIKKKYKIECVNISHQRYHKGIQWKICKALLMIQSTVRLISLLCMKRRNLYLIANSDWGLLYNIILISIAKTFFCKVYLHHHVYSYLTKKDIRMSLICLLMGKYDTHVMLSTEMAGQFKRTYTTQSNIFVLPNAFVLQDSWNYRPRPCKDYVTIGHISNLSIKKGLDIVIATFIALREKNLAVRLVLAGPVSSKREEDIIAEAQKRFPHDLDYRGGVYGEKKVQFFDDIDLMLFPTKYVNEAQPLVIIESLLKGIPVIAFDRGCINGLIGETGGVVIAPQSDYVHIASSIIEDWVRNKDEFERVKNRAIERGKELSVRARESLELFVHLLCNTHVYNFEK